MEVKIINYTHEANPFKYMANPSFDHELTLDELVKWCDENNMSGLVKVYYQGMSGKRHAYLVYYCED